MLPLLFRLGLGATRFLGKTALFGGAVSGAGLLIAGSSEKDGAVQNFLTDAFSVVATSHVEATQEASWQSFYKFLFKASELAISLGLDKFLKPIGIDLENLQDIARLGMVEDTTTRPLAEQEQVAPILTEDQALSEMSTFYQAAIKPKEPSLLESAWDSVTTKTNELGTAVSTSFNKAVENTLYYLTPEPQSVIMSRQEQPTLEWDGPTPWMQ